MIRVFLVVLLFATNATAAMTGSWLREAGKLMAIAEKTTEIDNCVEVEYKKLSENYLVGRDADGSLCGVYDLTFPTLRTLFATDAVSEIRLNTPKLSDYKIFLENGADEETARSFVEQEEVSLDRSWYSNLKFKNTSGLRQNSDGVYEEFKLSDVEMFNRDLQFTQREKNLLLASLTAPGERASDELVQFVENPRAIFENMNFQYDSLKKAYRVFLDLDFLPINGPVKLADHKIQYRVWLTRQTRGLIRTALNRLLRTVVRTQTGRIVSFVVNEAFNFIDMTYDYQATKLERTIRMALEGSVESELTTDELRKTLYLLYIRDNSLLINIITSAVQTQSVDLDNLFNYGKPAALTAFEQRQNISDVSFSNMYYEKECDLESVGYYFAKCADDGNIYSLISNTSLFIWTFGNPKVLNMNSPWEVFLKRSATYLLAGAVEINFLNFPNWIANQVSSALMTYSMSGVLDEAFVVGGLLAQSELNREDRVILNELMNKTIIPFVPRSLEGLERIKEKNKAIMGVN